MAIGAGVGGQFASKIETVYGTFVAPAVALDFLEVESESIEWKPSRTTGKGIYAGGMVPRRTQRATTTSSADGDIVTPVFTKGFGRYLASIMGTLGVSPVVVGATAAYISTHPLSPNTGQSLSFQIGKPTTDGVVHPYNYFGAKATKAVFEAKVNEQLRATISYDVRGVQESTALVAATYQTPNPALFWNQGIFQMGAFGAEVPVSGVTAFTLTIERPQATSEYAMDGTGLKMAPVQNDWAVVTVEIETDFVSKAAFADLFVTDTPQSIIATFTGGLIAGTSSFGLAFSLPSCSWESGPPTLDGPDILKPKFSLSALYDDTHVPVTAVYTSTDVTL